MAMFSLFPPIPALMTMIPRGHQGSAGQKFPYFVKFFKGFVQGLYLVLLGFSFDGAVLSFFPFKGIHLGH
jgi:hypothetical protein